MIMSQIFVKDVKKMKQLPDDFISETLGLFGLIFVCLILLTLVGVVLYFVNMVSPLSFKIIIAILIISVIASIGFQIWNYWEDFK